MFDFVGVKEMSVDLFVDDRVGAVGLFGWLGHTATLEVIVIRCRFHQL